MKADYWASPGLVLRGSMQDPSVQENVREGDGLVYLMLNLPFLCNYECLKCCNLLDLPRANALSGKNVRLERDRTTQVIQCASEAGVKVLVVAGEGEPLVHPDFIWLLESTVEAGLLPYVFTNGSRSTPENVELLLNKRASVIISLDSLDSAKYRRLTGGEGGGDLKALLEKIASCRSRFRPLIKRCEGIRIGSLAINMVVNRLNCDEVPQIKEFCGDDIVFVANEPTRIGLAEKNWRQLYGEQPESPLVGEAIAKVAATQRPLGTTSNGAWCAYMRNGLSVSSDGRWITCAYSLETAGGYSPLDADKLTVNDLVVANKVVMASVEDFYRANGHHRCILRHPNYRKFVKSLLGKRKT